MSSTKIVTNAGAINCSGAAARMEVLERFGILDTERDEIFDGIADLAAALFDAPVAVVNFIANGRQFFKAEIGIGARELPLASSICVHALAEGGVFVVPDLAVDDRFAGNPLVAVQDGMRFYAGYVLESDGVPIGAVCVLDRQPRPEGITEPQRIGLKALGKQTMFALAKSGEARRDRFRLTLTEQMQDAAGPVEMMEAATRLVGEYLGVSQVGFSEVDSDQAHLRVDRDWTNGRMASVVGRWRMDDFGTESIVAMKAGRTLVIDDVHDDARSNGSLAAKSYQTIGARSVIVVPLVRAGTLVATLFVHHTDPRAWHRDDIALVEDTATRLWGAVLRARADADIETRSRELEALIGTAPIGFAYFDRDHRYLRINDELAAINGLPAANHIGLCFDDLMPINATTVSPIIDQVFATGKVAKTVEVTGDTPLLPGVMRHWLTSWFPVFGDNGDVVSVGAWVVEITERRRAEDAQRASEAQLRQAQDMGGIGSWQWNHATGEGSVSASYRTLHEMPIDGPVTNHELLALMHPEDHATFREAVEKGIVSGERIVVEYRVVLPGDAGVRWIRGTGQRVGLDMPPVTAGIVEDITERHASNALVRAQAQQLASIYAVAPVGLCVLDRDLRYVQMNDRMAGFSGVPAADFIGKTSHEALPPFGSQSTERLQRVLAGESVIGAEFVGEMPNQPGVRLAWRANLIPLRDADDEIIGITVAADEITQEKAAADKLARAIERTEIAQAAARAVLYEFDPETGVASPSTNFSEITGYPFDTVVSLEWWQSLVHPADLPAFSATLEAAVVQGSDYSLEYRLRHNDGRWLWVSDRGRAVSTGNGHPNRLIGMFVDIDQQRQAQQALRESETQFRTTAEALPGMLFVASSEGKNSYVNEGFRSFTGRTDAELLGDRWSETLHPDDTERGWAIWNKAVATSKPYEAEYRFRRHDGEWRWHAVRALPVQHEDGAIARWVGCCIDIHERRLAEQDLETRMEVALADKKLLADLVENTDAFVQVVDADFNWLAVNAAAANEFERIFGVRPRVGLNLLKVLSDKPEHRDAVRAVWTRALGGEEFVETDQFGDPSRDRRAYEMRFRTLRDASGKPRGAYQFVYDVTDRLREQAELEAARAQLHEAQKLETIGQLTGGVAHDFNNLLTPIMYVLEIMERRVAGEERTTRLVSGALQSAERAKNLIQRLLAFARRQHLETKPVDLETLIEGMRDLIDRSIGPTIAVEVALEPSLCAVKVDPNQLELALLNLSVNARDAMPAGGKLRFEARHEDVYPGGVHELAPGSYICLSVSDTGNGMDAETLKRCIEPFFTSKGVGEGTGLGLSMVHGMMRQLGGGLVISSAPGQGTTMKLWLPCSEEKADQGVVSQASLTPSQHRATILLVDDEELVRESTADMLDRLGYDVVQAKDGAGALKILGERATIDVLVTDYLMPGMTGRELAERARRDRPGLPVLLITGYTRLDEIGPDLVRLEKPFRQAEFAARVAELVGTT